MSKIENVTRLKHMREAAIEAQGFIVECDLMIELSMNKYKFGLNI